MNPLLTAEQVGAVLSVPTTQVYRLAREGDLPSVSVGRYRRFRPEAIEAFVQGTKVERVLDEATR